MTKFNIALLSAVFACGLTVAEIADARGRHHHHHHGGRASFGVFIGGPVFPFHAPYYSPYYYPRYYYPQTVVVPAPSAPVYIEQGGAAAPAPAVAPTAQTSTAYWYYCRDSQTYYPYVQQCASPWQQVVPQSPPPG